MFSLQSIFNQELDSHGIGLRHQHSRHFIVLEHQYGCHKVFQEYVQIIICHLQPWMIIFNFLLLFSIAVRYRTDSRRCCTLMDSRGRQMPKDKEKLNDLIGKEPE